MARKIPKIKEPLILNGVEVRDLENLRENFNIETLTEYFADGKLVNWLRARYYEDEAEKVAELVKGAPEFINKLCEIFEVEPPVDEREINWRNERLEKLKNFTNDENILAKVDDVAFNQEELGDLLDENILRERLTYILEEKNQIFTKLYNQKPLPFDEVYEPARKWGEAIAPYVDDIRAILRKAVDEGQHVLLEGAQAALLDIDHGTYPYVTSSSTSAAGAFTGTGLAPNDLTRVIAVVKAYTTRVGEGAFPTEDFEEAGEKLRANGGEFGATTGRPRRCGWLDVPALKYSMELNGATVIALTKLDVLTGMGGIKVCVAYERDGEKLTTWPNDTRSLSEIKPVYETLPGWDDDITNCKTFEELPANAQAYVRYIEEKLKTPVMLIGVGADRNQTINRGM